MDPQTFIDMGGTPEMVIAEAKRRGWKIPAREAPRPQAQGVVPQGGAEMPVQSIPQMAMPSMAPPQPFPSAPRDPIVAAIPGRGAPRPQAQGVVPQGGAEMPVQPIPQMAMPAVALPQPFPSTPKDPIVAALEGLGAPATPSMKTSDIAKLLSQPAAPAIPQPAMPSARAIPDIPAMPGEDMPPMPFAPFRGSPYEPPQPGEQSAPSLLPEAPVAAYATPAAPVAPGGDAAMSQSVVAPPVLTGPGEQPMTPERADAIQRWADISKQIEDLYDWNTGLVPPENEAKFQALRAELDAIYLRFGGDPRGDLDVQVRMGGGG